ncbi:hypothetical protein K1T71_010836 [Dendrolimus kikuchii]|uniref:Uncharacterized protein n=1 Tax=Dendrolimus kikuchii TaxID=765133 RepID=A0ACC1CQ83_9NEOP|nr:hypothetical protein K1T71_010836 [Dendrolimus kikuchii]
MSYLSASENVGFSGIPQIISDATCATQYKMAVEGVPASCSEVNVFIHDNSGDDQSYITQFNDNFYTKFKIDPNELYTFHDSDIIAGEITVSQTEDTYMFDNEVKVKCESPSKELDVVSPFANGDVKQEVKEEVSNGHYVVIKHKPQSPTNVKETKTNITKTPKVKTQVKETIKKEPVTENRRQSVHSPKAQIVTVPSLCVKNNSINSVNTNNVKTTLTKQSSSETFLDVFKREQGLIEDTTSDVKTEPVAPVIKVPSSPPKKSSSGKSTQARSRRGRGPALHEALQRISVQRKAVALPNGAWHAPGEKLFSCGPLDDKRNAFRQLESSSSDDDHLPDFESGTGSVCVEECAAESRGARLALRRAALRRHVARAHTALRYVNDYKEQRALATLIKKQLKNPRSPCQIPTQTVNHLLATRGMPAILTSQERRQLRENGWSGGESGSREQRSICPEDGCGRRVVPCGRYCLAHITRAPEQRLYAACAAVFAGGARCNQPLLPLSDQTPLCAEHAWKRDNYDKLSKECRPKKVVRARVLPTAPRAPRRPKRRRRVPPRPRPAAPPPSIDHSLSEINVCSNSSNYDSSEDTTMGTLSENEYHVTKVEVGHVPPDDILDPAVLSQMPDEAFTEFFNQAEGGTPFAESSELAAALEAVLDERGLDERVLDERALDNIADCVFTHTQHATHLQIAKNKMQVPASVAMELSSVAPS